jgi:hypothetical protein
LQRITLLSADPPAFRGLSISGLVADFKESDLTVFAFVSARICAPYDAGFASHKFMALDLEFIASAARATKLKGVYDDCNHEEMLKSFGRSGHLIHCSFGGGRRIGRGEAL